MKVLAVKKTISAFIVFFVMLFSAANVYSKNISANTYIMLFESWCLQNSNDFSQIDRMARAEGLMPVPKPMQEGDPVLASHGGSAYSIIRDGHSFIISYAKHGGCAVSADFMNTHVIRDLISRYYKVKLFSVNNEGIQSRDIYFLSPKSIYPSGIIFLTYMNSNPGSSTTTLAYLPKKIIPKNIRLKINNLFRKKKIRKITSAISSYGSEQMYAAEFRSWCINNKNNFSQIDIMARSEGLKDITKSIKKIMKKRYRSKLSSAYLNTIDKRNYVIVNMENFGCLVVAKGIDGSKLRKIITSQYKIKPVALPIADVGAKYMYIFSSNSALSGSLLTLSYYLGGSSTKILGFFPEQFIPESIKEKLQNSNPLFSYWR